MGFRFSAGLRYGERLSLRAEQCQRNLYFELILRSTRDVLSVYPNAGAVQDSAYCCRIHLLNAGTPYVHKSIWFWNYSTHKVCCMVQLPSSAGHERVLALMLTSLSQNLVTRSVDLT